MSGDQTQPDGYAVPAGHHDPLTPGTPVLAWPGSRESSPLVTRTRSEVWALGSGDRVVMVEGFAGGIALTHVDVLPVTASGADVGNDVERIARALHDHGLCVEVPGREGDHDAGRAACHRFAAAVLDAAPAPTEDRADTVTAAARRGLDAERCCPGAGSMAHVRGCPNHPEPAAPATEDGDPA